MTPEEFDEMRTNLQRTALQFKSILESVKSYHQAAIETAKRIQSQLKQYKEIAEEYSKKWIAIVEAAKRIQSQLKQYKEIAEEKHIAIVEMFRELSKPIVAIDKLSEAQFVYWDRFTVDFCDAICSNEDTDAVLMKYEIEGNPAKIERVIRDCYSNELLNEKFELFNQSIKAYRLGMYEVSVLGLFAVVDNVLAKTSGDVNKTSMYTRVVPILDKLAQDEILDEYEITVLTLFQTLEQTVTYFTKKKDFDDVEPLEVNRHWLMHGRRLKSTTQLDCVKVLYFLYGILLVDEINKRADGD